jgi:hypothetical protein
MRSRKKPEMARKRKKPQKMNKIWSWGINPKE